jgi:hypothetical protein
MRADEAFGMPFGVQRTHIVVGAEVQPTARAALVIQRVVIALTQHSARFRVVRQKVLFAGQRRVALRAFEAFGVHVTAAAHIHRIGLTNRETPDTTKVRGHAMTGERRWGV